MLMKFCISILFILFVSATGFSQEKTYSTKSARKKFYNDLVDKYSSADIKKIWYSDKKAEKFDQWLDEYKESNLIDDFGTVIHELYHGNSVSTKNGRLYIVNENLEIDVPYTEIYKSDELNKIIRKSMQDSIARYGLYVAAKNKFLNVTTSEINTGEHNTVSSVLLGIYGLLEEFAAYSYDAKASMELFDFFAVEKKWGENYSPYDFRHMVLGECIAYYEFRIFIAYYLLHAKNKHPQIYKELYANTDLRKAFTLINDNFYKLIEDFHLRTDNLKNEEEEQMLLINSFDFTGSDEDMIRFFKYIDVSEDEGIYQIITAEKGSKKIKILEAEEYALFEKEYKSLKQSIQNERDTNGSLIMYIAMPVLQEKYLKQIFTPELSAEIEKFKIKELTVSNYKSTQ